MKLRKSITYSITALALSVVSLTATAAMVMQMGMGDLVVNADKVFRGTVLTKEPGTVVSGGGELSTVIYTIRVDDAIKGDFGPDGKAVTLTMLGNMKVDANNGNMKRLFSLNINPDLRVGSDYVLFTTAPSAGGLSTTVGLDQGLFHIFNNADGNEATANGLGNQGIFGGPVSYEELKAAIYDELN